MWLLLMLKFLSGQNGGLKSLHLLDAVVFSLLPGTNSDGPCCSRNPQFGVDDPPCGVFFLLRDLAVAYPRARSPFWKVPGASV